MISEFLGEGCERAVDGDYPRAIRRPIIAHRSDPILGKSQVSLVQIVDDHRSRRAQTAGDLARMPAEACGGVHVDLARTRRKQIEDLFRQNRKMLRETAGHVDRIGTMYHRLIMALSIGFLWLLAGCAPISFNLSLGSSDGELEATEALNDAPGEDQKVVMIDLRGMIADNRSQRLLGQGPNPVDSVLARFAMAEADSEVVGVILRINSPGGTVTASDIIHREIVRFRQETGKPVIASFGEVAASGGYYVALACDAILTEPTTITGSIGVIIPTINVSEGLNRIGVHSRAIKSGPNKDLANPLEPVREGQLQVLQAMVDEMYARFVGLVDERRTGLSVGSRDEAIDGRVMTGARAVEIGLADQVGGVRDAHDLVLERAGIERAALIKYRSRGAVTRTPYASTELPLPQAQDRPLIDLGLDRLSLEPGLAYYVWVP